VDVSGPISFQQAARAGAAQRAYGPRPTPIAASVHGVSPQTSVGPTPGVQSTGDAGAARLVAGRVAVPADPALASNADPAALSSGGAFAMYTRSADRVEVATRVAIGQQVDRRA
jgi:hypothetical protein